MKVFEEHDLEHENMIGYIYSSLSQTDENFLFGRIIRAIFLMMV